MDESQLANPGYTSLRYSPYVLGLGVSIVGAAVGNGVFSLADFAPQPVGGDVIFDTGGVRLDLSKELVGQPTLADAWGTTQPGGSGGDFNLLGNGTNPTAPDAVWYLSIGANGGSGDAMALTSFVCASAETAVCTPLPRPDCDSAGAGMAKLQGSNDPTRGKLLWSWSLGNATLADFGDPVNGTTNYRLCLYDDGMLKMSAAIAGGGDCDGRPCWSQTGTAGLKYKNRLGNAGGITQVKIKAGTGIAKVQVKGRGSALGLPFPVGDTSNVTVQLVKNPGAGPACWESVFPTPAQSYDATRLKFLDKIP